MINIFKIFDVPRVLLLLLIVVAYAVFSDMMVLPMTTYELMNLVTSEHLSQGNIMYKDVFHWTEPLTVLVQYIFFQLFGRDIIYYRIIALAIVFFQAIFLNQVLNEKNCYDQRSSIPALIYLSFILLFPDMVSLSAVLLANTFLLISFYFLISYIKDSEYTQPLFWIGFYVAIAFLFYAPYVVFLPAVLLVLALYTPIDTRKVVTILYAFVLPSLLVFGYYFWNNAAGFYVQFFLQRVVNFQANHYLSFHYLLMISAIPLLWMLFGFFAIARSSSFVNYQYRIIQSFFLLFVFAVLCLLLVKERSAFTMWQLVPYVSVIATYFLVLQKKKWIADFFLLLMFGSLIFVHSKLMNALKDGNLSEENHLLVRFSEKDWNQTKGAQTVLVLDENIAAYSKYKLSTPFLNWNMSEQYFRDMDGYDAVSLLDRYFSKDLPDIIVDPNGVMNKVFYRLPLLSNKYSESKSGVYVLKKITPAI